MPFLSRDSVTLSLSAGQSIRVSNFHGMGVQLACNVLGQPSAPSVNVPTTTGTIYGPYTVPVQLTLTNTGYEAIEYVTGVTPNLTGGGIATYSTDTSGNVTGLVGPSGSILPLAQTINSMFVNWKFSNTTNLRAALSAGIGQDVAASYRGRILFVGDSLTANTNIGGIGQLVAQSFPTQFANIFRAKYGANIRADNINGFRSATDDPRRSTVGFSGPGSRKWGGPYSEQATPAIGNSISFTPGVAFDRVNVIYAGTGSSGPFTLDIGGAVLDTRATSGANVTVAYESTLVSGTSSTTINLKTTTTNPVYIAAIGVRLSTNPGCEVWNGGSPSSYTGDWNSVGSGLTAGATALALADTNAKNATFVSLGYNDIAGFGLSIATYTANLATIFSNFLTFGDVVFIAPFAPADTAQASNVIAAAAFNAYYDAAIAQATASGIPSIDFRKAQPSWLAANALGLFADGYHAKGPMYGQLASAIVTGVGAVL